MTDDNGDKEWHEYWAEGELWDGIFSPINDTMGEPVFALFIGTVLAVSLYSWTENFMMPAIVLALLGGTLITAAPASAAYIGGLLVAVAFGLGLLAIWGDE